MLVIFGEGSRKNFVWGDWAIDFRSKCLPEAWRIHEGLGGWRVGCNHLLKWLHGVFRGSVHLLCPFLIPNAKQKIQAQLSNPVRHQLVQPNTSSEFNQSAPHFYYNFSILFIVSLPSPMGSSHYAPPKLNPTAQADEIRDDLKTRGVVLSDEKGAHGDGLTVTSWRCEVLGCRGGKACVLTFHVGRWQGTAIQTSVYDMEFMTLQGCNLVFGCAWWISLEGTELEEKWYC